MRPEPPTPDSPGLPVWTYRETDRATNDAAYVPYPAAHEDPPTPTQSSVLSPQSSSASSAVSAVNSSPPDSLSSCFAVSLSTPQVLAALEAGETIDFELFAAWLAQPGHRDILDARALYLDHLDHTRARKLRDQNDQRAEAAMAVLEETIKDTHELHEAAGATTRERLQALNARRLAAASLLLHTRATNTRGTRWHSPHAAGPVSPRRAARRPDLDPDPALDPAFKRSRSRSRSGSGSGSESESDADSPSPRSPLLPARTLPDDPAEPQRAAPSANSPPDPTKPDLSHQHFPTITGQADRALLDSIAALAAASDQPEVSLATLAERTAPDATANGLPLPNDPAALDAEIRRNPHHPAAILLTLAALTSLVSLRFPWYSGDLITRAGRRYKATIQLTHDHKGWRFKTINLTPNSTPDTS